MERAGSGERKQTHPALERWELGVMNPTHDCIVARQGPDWASCLDPGRPSAAQKTTPEADTGPRYADLATSVELCAHLQARFFGGQAVRLEGRLMRGLVEM